MKILALIPARGGSKRIPNKNVREFCGKPLIAWTIEFALGCELFDQVLLSTDSPEIMAAGVAAGLIKDALRPAHLATDTASTLDVALYELARAESAFGAFDAVAILQPTTPYRNREIWLRAIELLRESGTEAVIGTAPASPTPYHCFQIGEKGFLDPLWPDMLPLRTQDLPPTLYVTGSLYLVDRHVLSEQRTFFPARTRAVVCASSLENIDLDTPEDWKLAELLFSHHLR